MFCRNSVAFNSWYWFTQSILTRCGVNIKRSTRLYNGRRRNEPPNLQSSIMDRVIAWNRVPLSPKIEGNYRHGNRCRNYVKTRSVGGGREFFFSFRFSASSKRARKHLSGWQCSENKYICVGAVCLMECLSFLVCLNTLSLNRFCSLLFNVRENRAAEKGKTKKNNFIFLAPKITILKRIIFQNEHSVMF